MSDTPRTDSAKFAMYRLENGEYVFACHAEHSRQLERDLAAVTREREAYQKQCERQSHEANKWSKEYLNAKDELKEAVGLLVDCRDALKDAHDESDGASCRDCDWWHCAERASAFLAKHADQSGDGEGKGGA